MKHPGFNRRALLAAMTAVGLWPRLGLAENAEWTWAVDYGPNTDPLLARDYDLLVLEPDHARPIEQLRGEGARLLGYISIGEIERSRSFASQLEKAGALQVPNSNWPDARLVDFRHPLWRSLLIEQLIPEVLSKGYDGIFMDTLDNAEAMERNDPKANAGMIAAAVEVVSLIRSRFPTMTIMMNRGYALLPTAAPLVDLLLGEAMASRWNFSTKVYEFTSAEDWSWQADRLRGAQLVNPALKLTTLDYWAPTDQATVAELYARERVAGFHPYVATLALDRLLPEPRP